MKKLRIVILITYGLARRDSKWSLNDGQIQNPSNPFGIVPLSNFVPRGYGFVHHSIAILYHQVPNLSFTIRNFFIAVRRRWWGVGGLRGRVGVRGEAGSGGRSGGEQGAWSNRALPCDASSALHGEAVCGRGRSEKGMCVG
jgi:hypothetical protein